MARKPVRVANRNGEICVAEGVATFEFAMAAVDGLTMDDIQNVIRALTCLRPEGTPEFHVTTDGNGRVVSIATSGTVL